jgi:riboflavin kinase/FMN adenylyltransferase
MLTQGNVEKAAVALGRRYSVVGDVIHGDGRGRGIGIPTANLAVWPERLLPALGVYAGWVGLPNGERHPAAASIGVRPTFEPAISVPRLEAMLLDFDRDLYGQTLSFEFVKFLRGEERYDTVEKLLEQIRQDVQDTRGVLSHDPGSPDLSAGPQGTQP